MDNMSDWKPFLRKHSTAIAVFALAAALVVIGLVFVFVWFVSDAQSSGLVPSSLSLWTMNNVIGFILSLVFWELLIIGIPTVVAAVLGWQWWNRLPVEEKLGYNFTKRSRTSRGSGGGSLLFFIGFCVKVYLDGNWNVPIATWTLNYVVDSMLLVLAWLAVIFGIPGLIVGIWWIRRELKRP